MSTSKPEGFTSMISLLDFPVEVQTQIYRQYYCQPWIFYARDHHFTSDLPPKQPSNSSLRNPSINLLLTCRDIYNIASSMLLEFYTNIVSLVAVEGFSDIHEWTVFLSGCSKLIAEATRVHMRLDQAEHFSGWDLLDEMQGFEAESLKDIVLEDQFVVKRARHVVCKRNKQTQQVTRLPKTLVNEIIEMRYRTASTWGYDTWRRDYDWRHVRYPVRLLYLIRFRIDQLELQNNIFEVEVELTLDDSMDLEWQAWIIQRETVRKLERYADELEQWDVVDLDHTRKAIGLDSHGYRAQLPIVRARDVKFD